MSTPEQQAEYRRLLDDAVETAGSLAGAAQAIGRDVRTLRRWRDGQHPIPDVIVPRLRAVVAGHPGAPAADLAQLQQLGPSLAGLAMGFSELTDLAERVTLELRQITDVLMALHQRARGAGVEAEDAETR